MRYNSTENQRENGRADGGESTAEVTTMRRLSRRLEPGRSMRRRRSCSSPALAGRPGHALCSLPLPDAGPDGHHRRRNPAGCRGGQLRHDLGQRRVPGRVHVRAFRGNRAVSADRQARYTCRWLSCYFASEMCFAVLRQGLEPGLRPVRRGVWQVDADGCRPGHTLQTVRPCAAGRDRFLRCLRVLDALLDASDQCVYRRIFVVEVDILGLRAGFVGRDGAWYGVSSDPTGPPKPCACDSIGSPSPVFVAWIIAIDFAFSWYRKWGGWTSNAFVACVALCVALPLALAAWMGSGLSRDEHLKHVLGSRVYVLSLITRGLMLLYMVAVLTIVGLYCTELRGYPGVTAVG